MVFAGDGVSLLVDAHVELVARETMRAWRSTLAAWVGDGSGTLLLFSVSLAVAAFLAVAAGTCEAIWVGRWCASASCSRVFFVYNSLAARF